MNDVFKDMQVKVGCDYLSALRPSGQKWKRLNRNLGIALLILCRMI